MEAVITYFCLILSFVNLNMVISDDELYKKFSQTDYKVNFERSTVIYINKSYGEFSVVTFKPNRTHFATNTTLLLFIDMGYDLEFIVQAYKFLSNEFRVFPLHFQYNFCKALKYNVAGCKNCAEQCGNLNCPFKKNIPYVICNCLFDESKLPPFMPNGKFKLSFEGMYKNEVIVILEMLLTIYRPILPDKRFG